MTEPKDPELYKQLGERVFNLRVKAGIEIAGLAFGINMSTNYIRLIERGEGNITTKTAMKISAFFGISLEDFYAFNKALPSYIRNSPSIKKFYEENQSSPEFFIGRKKEDSAAHFLKTILLPTDFFNNPREVSQVIEESEKKYGKSFTSKELSRELSRMAEKGMIKAKSHTYKKNTKVYQKDKSPGTNP